MKRSEVNNFKTIWISKITALRLSDMVNAMSRKNLEKGIKKTVKQSELADRALNKGLNIEARENKIK